MWNPFYKYVDLRLHQQSKDPSLPLAKLIRESKLDSEESNPNSLTHVSSRRKSLVSAFVTRGGNVVGGGADSVINALAGYLRYLEGTGRDDWQEYVLVHLIFFFFFLHLFSLKCSQNDYPCFLLCPGNDINLLVSPLWVQENKWIVM